ncbi:TPA: YggT family protein [Candidatus Galligastranaerophilus intestinigallinarum]|nr:YggT family protein [Candidatus Galligastranaerophilus intestinigallinarum]
MIARPSYLIYQLFNLIMLIMLIRVLLSWFPNFNWYKEPWYSIRKFTDFIFEPFRKVIPPIGMIDISPIFAFIVLSIVQNLLCNLLIGMGL